MALRNIVQEGDESLLKKSRPITQFNDRLFELLDDMKETLAVSNGVGLAAPQVGVLRRVVVVMDIDNDDEMIELINPEIVSADGQQDGPEGCLSLPNVWGLVERPEHVVVKAQNRNGEEFTVEGTELLARAFCHELDHLEGVLFREHVHQYLTEEEMNLYYRDNDETEETDDEQAEDEQAEDEQAEDEQ